MSGFGTLHQIVRIRTDYFFHAIFLSLDVLDHDTYIGNSTYFLYINGNSVFNYYLVIYYFTM